MPELRIVARSPLSPPDDGSSLAVLRAPEQISRISIPSPFTDLPAALAAGLRDRYVLERQLGRGGMATVYLAQDVKHDRPVVLVMQRLADASRSRRRHSTAP